MTQHNAYMFNLEADLEMLEAKLALAMAGLNALGNMQTSGGGPDSLMAHYARDTLKKIKELGP